MSAHPAARLAAWASLALLGVGACAEGVTESDPIEAWDDEGAEGGIYAPPPIDSDGGAGGASASGSGGGNADPDSGSGSGTGGCGDGQHFCGGVCVGNTPETGCVLSSSCEACTPPANAAATCNDGGTCDFTCNDGYAAANGQCACDSQCCSDADCSGGNICTAFTCQPPPCYLADCAVSCLFKLQCGGICVADSCTCFPCPS